ncbi:hypothetical protein RFI_33286, partial [Reticulomyxa filosa]
DRDRDKDRDREIDNGEHLPSRANSVTQEAAMMDEPDENKSESADDERKSKSEGPILKSSQSLPPQTQAVQLDFFMTREFCEKILQSCPQGTFTLRLSATVPGGLVLSYLEKKMGKINHILLTRIHKDQYLVTGKQKTKGSNVTTQKKVATSLSQLIRSFTKLQYIYTSHKVFAKKVLF